MSKVENAIIWLTRDFSERIGVELWDEVSGHIEIIYQEYEENKWKEVSRVGPIDVEMFDKLFEAGNFLLKFQSKDK